MSHPLRSLVSAALVASAAAAAVLLAACAPPPAPPNDSAADATPPRDADAATATDDDAPPAAPTYYGEVAPILSRRCVSCHQAGGIAPFVLDQFAEAHARADAIRAATASRIMPPWGVTDDGSCQSFRDSRWLSQDELATLARWAERGAPEGTPAAVPSPPTSALSGEVLSLAMPVTYTPVATPASPEDDYRCFLLDASEDRDRFVTGFDARPGDARVVHHALVFNVDPDQVVGRDAAGQPVTNGAVIAGLRASDPAHASWPCFGGPGDNVAPEGLTVAWAPGAGATHFPDGTGLPLRRGHLLVLQVHYHLAPGVTGADRTSVQLELRDRVDRPAVVMLPDLFLATAFGPSPATLPADTASAPYTWRLPASALLDSLRAAGVTAGALELRGVFPHMHSAGRQLHFAVERGGDAGAETCGAAVPAWDFHWQQFYFYNTPLALDAQSTLRVTCEYDTRGRTGPVRPGLGSNDEMCMLGIFAVPVAP